MAQHGDPAADMHDLLQLVGDKDDRHPVVPEDKQLFKQLLGLLRGQHGGGLVHDEDLNALDQRLQNLHLLHLAHAQIPDPGPGVNVEVVLVGDLLSLLHGPVKVVKGALGGFYAQGHIFSNGQGGKQHKVLVDHAHPLTDGVKGVLQLLFLAVDEDLALLGGLHTKQDFHQGGLARPVTHQGVDLVLPHPEGNVLIRYEAVGVDLRDVFHAQYFIGHI